MERQTIEQILVDFDQKRNLFLGVFEVMELMAKAFENGQNSMNLEYIQFLPKMAKTDFLVWANQVEQIITELKQNAPDGDTSRAKFVSNQMFTNNK